MKDHSERNPKKNDKKTKQMYADLGVDMYREMATVRLISMLCVLLMALSLIPALVHAASGISAFRLLCDILLVAALLIAIGAVGGVTFYRSVQHWQIKTRTCKG